MAKKNYNQSKKAKEEFLRTSVLACYMRGDPNKVFTREELSQNFNLNDRTIREMVAEVANYLPVISLSNSAGYRVLSFDDETATFDLLGMQQDISHQINEFKSRIANLNARLKPLVALSKVIDKELKKRIEEPLEQ